MVYEGPGIAKAVIAGLIQRLAAAGIRDLKAAVGKS
jgi:dihydroorotate dehydrogenase